MKLIRILCGVSLLLFFLAGCHPPRVRTLPPVPNHVLTRWHTPFGGGVPWRLTSGGVEIKGSGVERTLGEPLTVTWIWEHYRESIDRWSLHYRVPVELVIAAIAVEAVPIGGGSRFSRDPKSLRREKGFVSEEKTPALISVGLMQTTVATARAVLSREGIEPSRVTRAYLEDADNGIHAGVALMAWQARGRLCNVATLYDPPVVFAAYNAGGLYPMGGRKNRWKIKQFPPGSGRYLDRATRFFNDAVAALKKHPTKPNYGYLHYIYAPPVWPEDDSDQGVWEGNS